MLATTAESFDCEGYTKGENKMDEYILKTAAMEIVRRTSGDYAAAFAAIRKLPAASVVQIDGCEGCIWLNTRHQKCSCCRRNQYLKDNYKG